jgi:hypothetical protein
MMYYDAKVDGVGLLAGWKPVRGVSVFASDLDELDVKAVFAPP